MIQYTGCLGHILIFEHTLILQVLPIPIQILIPSSHIVEFSCREIDLCGDLTKSLGIEFSPTVPDTRFPHECAINSHGEVPVVRVFSLPA